MKPKRPSPRSQVRILLIDDHAVFRHGLRSILQAEIKRAVFGEAENASQALEMLRQKAWDVAVLDITMPGRSGLEVLQRLKETRPETRVLVLSMHAEEHYAVRVLRAGAAGYITKARAPREMVEAVKQVIAGRVFLSPSASRRLLDHLAGAHANSAHESLSNREFEIMRLMALGKSGKQIGADLHISVQTVSTHRSNILRKMGFESGAQVVRYAIEHKLVE